MKNLKFARAVLIPLLCLWSLGGCSRDAELEQEVERLRADLEQSKEELAALQAASKTHSGAPKPSPVSKQDLESNLGVALAQFQNSLRSDVVDVEIDKAVTTNVLTSEEIYPHSANLSLIVTRTTESGPVRTPLEFNLRADNQGNWIMPSVAEVRGALETATVADASKSIPEKPKETYPLDPAGRTGKEFPPIQAIGKDRETAAGVIAAEAGRDKINKFKGLPFQFTEGKKNSPANAPDDATPFFKSPGSPEQPASDPPLEAPGPNSAEVTPPSKGAAPEVPPAGTVEKADPTTSKNRLPAKNENDVPVVKVPAPE